MSEYSRPEHLLNFWLLLNIIVRRSYTVYVLHQFHIINFVIVNLSIIAICYAVRAKVTASCELWIVGTGNHLEYGKRFKMANAIKSTPVIFIVLNLMK